MRFTDSRRLVTRARRQLPPAAPLPAALQTLGCRLWPLDYLERCRARYGSRFTVYPIDMMPLIFLSDPHDVRTLLSAPPSVVHAGAGGAVVAPLFGERSFVLQEEDRHRRGRAAVLPAFRGRAAESYAEMVDELVDREVAGWPTGGPCRLLPRLAGLALRVILGVLFSGGGRVVEELHVQLLAMLEVMASPVLQEPRLRHLPGWRGVWKRMVDRREAVDKLVFELIRTRRAAGGDGEDVLAALLAARPDGSSLSDREIRDDLVSLLIAGQETTAAELAWAFQLLAHNPAVQDRLAEEVAADGDCDYLSATVWEVLRRRPVFLFASPRLVVKPIEIGGWSYPPGAQLLACIYLLHHDPAVFPDPHEFRPERFLDTAPPPRSWLPWGGGGRRCLGQHLATREMESVLRTVLVSRRVLPASRSIERARWRTVLVAPHAGSRVVFRPRSSRRAPLVSVPAGASV